MNASLADPRHFDLLRALTVSQYKLKDQSTFFGLLWSFMNPLLMLGVLFVVFSRRIGSDIEHYALYLLVGIVQYTHFANATSNSMRSLLSMKQLAKETVFPKELLVLSSTLSDTVDFLIAMSVCLLVASFSGIEPSFTQAMLPVVVALQFLLVLWVSLLLSCLYPLARDIDHIYQVFLRALFFATPIFYTLDFIGDGPAHWVVLLNPLTHLMQLARETLVYGHAPDWGGVALVAAANLAGVAIAWRVFKHYEQRLAEYL